MILGSFFSRIVLPFSFAALAAGCQVDDKITASQLMATDKGVVVFYAAFADQECSIIDLKLAKQEPDSKGWVLNHGLHHEQRVFTKDTAGVNPLPAGEWGIVEFECSGYRQKTRLTAKQLSWAFRHVVYERPIATFSVQPGEVVNIGMLKAIRAGGVGISQVAEIPDGVLREFRERFPTLNERMTTRLMSKPELPTLPGAPLAAQPLRSPAAPAGQVQ
ncbi:hypothetical protein GCM10007036_42370 [Alsobacter metallidurans]|uniref:Lipoprotein n=1 Tax=Alsobacter metallidurans TaxID=340221 RepID=A0A917MLP3_9HYPH|nr:hypothetical protein [Alsobacter metallidurans]GGH31270.1 hypothetical protein GCM10007036_42370 [Alsobacter metallidurans]